MSKIKEKVKIFNQFMDDIKSINRLLSACQSSLTQSYIPNIYEMCFLKIHLSWEIFLEKIFLEYLMYPRRNGVKTYINPKDEGHLMDIIKSGKKFMEWSDKSKLLEKANYFLHNGDPFTSALNSKSSVLNDIKKIRNAVAHNSGTAKSHFDKIVINMGLRAISPGVFLKKDKIRGKTFYSFYLSNLIFLAKQLSN